MKTANEILSKWLNDINYSGKDSVLNAMKEIAELAYEKGFWDKQSNKNEKEQFLSLLFPEQ